MKKTTKSLKTNLKSYKRYQMLLNPRNFETLSNVKKTMKFNKMIPNNLNAIIQNEILQDFSNAVISLKSL